MSPCISLHLPASQVDHSHVAVLMIDASRGLVQQDRTISNLALAEALLPPDYLPFAAASCTLTLALTPTLTLTLTPNPNPNPNPLIMTLTANSSPSPSPNSNPSPNQDKTIADKVCKQAKSCILVGNKSDPLSVSTQP